MNPTLSTLSASSFHAVSHSLAHPLHLCLSASLPVQLADLPARSPGRYSCTGTLHGCIVALARSLGRTFCKTVFRFWPQARELDDDDAKRGTIPELWPSHMFIGGFAYMSVPR